MDERCISLKCFVIVISFFFLLDNRLAISIAVNRFKKDNHTIRDQKALPSNFNFRMHNLHPLFGNGDQLKTLYTNLGSANNQVQLKYITGQGLLSPLIIRASDLGLPGSEQAQLQGLPDFLNDFNNLNQNQFPMLSPPRQKNQMLHSRPDPFVSGDQDVIMKRPRRKRKKNAFKFNDPDSMEFIRQNSMEFEANKFPNVHSNHVKKHSSFEKSYDELVHSAKKLADTVENISDGDDALLEGDTGKDKKLSNNFDSDSSKFNFDDEMKLSQKDEDELDNLEKLENLSGGFSGNVGSSGVIGQKKNMHSDTFNDFESNEKNAFSSDNDKFGDLFNDKFSDLFKESNYKENNDKYDDEDNYDKLYDKIIDNITGNGKKKDKKSDKHSISFDAMFADKSKKGTSKGKKTNKKKKPIDDGGDDTGSQFENTTSDEVNANKEQDEMKITNENEQTEYNTNTSGHTETGDYDYAGYAKDPNEQSEEIVDNEVEKPTGDKNGGDADKGQHDGGGSGGGKYEDVKYQDDQQTTIPPSDSDYKEQPPNQHQSTAGTGDERTESEMRSFKQPAFRNFNSYQTQPFTRMPMKSRQLKSNIPNGGLMSNRFNNTEFKFEKFNKPANYSRSTKLKRVRTRRIRQ